MSGSLIEQKIEELISPAAQSMGYDIVRVRFTGGNNGVLQVLAENSKDRSFGIDDCTKLSRAISAILDVEDLIHERYNLEVSSPGLDRPLTKISDYEIFVGKEAKLAVKTPIDGRKRFSGVLGGTEGSNIIINVADMGENIKIPFSEIDSAKLIISDNILKKKK